MTALASASRSDRHPFCDVQTRIRVLAELAERSHAKALGEDTKLDDRAAAIALRALGQIADEQKEAKKEGQGTPQQLLQRLSLELAQQVMRALRGRVDEQPADE